MAFESTKGMSNTWNPKKEANGDPRKTATPQDFLDGWYVDLKEQQGKFKSNVYVVETEGGEKLSVWGDTCLDGEMQKIAPGAFVRMQWLGYKVTKEGEKKPEKQRTNMDYFHDWEVFVDKEKSRSITTPSHKTAEPTSEAAVSSGPEEELDLPF